MNDEHTALEVLRGLLQSLESGAAIANPETWHIAFENARFFQWFPPTADSEDALDARLPGLDRDKAESRLAKDRPFTYETEFSTGPRTVVLRITLKKETIRERTWLVADCQNISRQREAEYMLDSYSRLAEKKAREVAREKERVEKLLLNIMPRAVYEEMKDFGTTTPQRFDAATVLMLDFAGFTNMAVSRDPAALIAELNDIFSAFDRISDLFGCERIKTIGDAYLAVSGLPEPTQDHALNIARVALRMRRYLQKRNASHPNQWLGRIGIATGPVVGSIVGIQKYVYDVFGPAVNLAARLEAFSQPMRITLCSNTRELLQENFVTQELGEFEVKGFGTQPLYALEEERLGR
ncbi:MAG: adenylate/guanylate cyclase domain-containing protein [Alphaproteobacteria bacterium]